MCAPIILYSPPGRYLCHPGGKTQSTITATHQLIGLTYTVHRRGAKKESYLSWTLWFLQVPTTLDSLQSTENLQILSNTYIGTGSISSQPKKVFSTLYHLGPRKFALVNKHYTRKWNTSGMSYRLAISHLWLSTFYITNLTVNAISTMDKQPLTTSPTPPTTMDQTTRISP